MRAQNGAAPALAATVVVISVSGLLLETAYRNNSRVEAALCRFQVCATGRLVDTLRARRLQPGREAAALALGESLEALRRDPAAAERWCDAAEAWQTAGRPARAAEAFRRAVELAPHSPPVLLQAANYYFRTEDTAAALPLAARVLQLVRDYDQVIFLLYDRSGVPIRELLHAGIPDDAEAARAYFRHCLASRQSSSQDARATYEHLQRRGYETPTLRALYVESLLTRREYDEAQSLWTGSARDVVYNGGFEAPFTGARLDWMPGRSPHVAETREMGGAQSGNWCYRVAFDGAANLDYRGLAQTAIAAPGSYRLRGWIRVSGITTDRGIYLRVFDPEAPPRLDARTPEYLGTAAWTSFDLPLHIGGASRILQIQLCRDASWKFDNRLAGTAWIDSIVLSREP